MWYTASMSDKRPSQYVLMDKLACRLMSEGVAVGRAYGDRPSFRLHLDNRDVAVTFPSEDIRADNMDNVEAYVRAHIAAMLAYKTSA